MKTTIEIDDFLFRKIKKTATAKDQSLKQVITSALQSYLGETPTKKNEVRLLSHKSGGLVDGLSWNNWDKIRDLAYENR